MSAITSKTTPVAAMRYAFGVYHSGRFNFDFDAGVDFHDRWAGNPTASEMPHVNLVEFHSLRGSMMPVPLFTAT
jgi:hypothetical protein